MITENELIERAKGLLGFLESDFGQSGRDVRIEAIRLELERVYDLGVDDGADMVTIK